MKEILFPRAEESSATGHGNSSFGEPSFNRLAIPDSLSRTDVSELLREQLNAVVIKIDNLEREIDGKGKAQQDKLDEQEKRLERQSARSVEVIGVFSSILALLIIDVNIVKSADTFISAILLIVALTCSVAIFSVLIHMFFSPEDKRKFGMPFWIPIGILSTLVGIGCIAFYKGFDLYEKGKSPLIPDLELRDSSKALRSNPDIEMHDGSKKN